MRTLHRVPVSYVVVEEEEELYDELSEFPDDVLGLVVSFLPTKEAVATSILSRRWRYVWLSSPVMNLDFADFPKEMRSRKLAFIKFVEDAMQNFQGEKLTKFRLRLDGYEGHPKPSYEDWIGFAVQNRAAEIDVCLPKGRDVKVPNCLFNCSWLKSLSLKMVNRSSSTYSRSSSSISSRNLPSPARLKMLEKLHLCSVPLPRGHFLGELFAYCLQLKQVSLVECKMDGVLDINSESLQKLTIRGCNWAHPVRVSVTAPALRTLCCYGRAADEHIFDRMESLEEVELELTAPSRLFIKEEQSQQCVLGLVEDVGNVHSLKLSSWCIENLCRVKDMQERMHINVKCLTLTIMRKQRMICLAPLIASCCNLRYLKIAVEPSENLGMTNIGEDGGEGGTTPEKTELKHLKCVELALIDENKTAKDLISYLLENSPLLEKVSIIPSNDGLDLEEFKDRISRIKKRSWSTNVVIDFHNETAKKRKRGEI